MKHLIITPLAFALLFVLGLGGLHAQPINMGANPVNFGNGCTYAFIRNTNFNQQKLALGYQWSCGGPSFGIETIWFNTSTGRLGMGVNNPSYQIHLSQNSAAKPGSAYWTVISDRRFKQDVQSFDDGLGLIRKMNPVSFRYKEGLGVETHEEFVGVIAQELQEIAPYMVKALEEEDGPGEYLAVDLHALDFALVNAVQELDAEVSTLRAENKALEARLARLESMLGTHEKETGAGSDPNGRLSIGLPVPNPSGTSTSIHFRLPEASDKGLLEILDLQGAVLAQQSVGRGEGTARFELQDYAAGQYLIRLTDGAGHVATQNLVVAR